MYSILGVAMKVNQIIFNSGVKFVLSPDNTLTGAATIFNSENKLIDHFNNYNRVLVDKKINDTYILYTQKNPSQLMYVSGFNSSSGLINDVSWTKTKNKAWEFGDINSAIDISETIQSQF